MLEQEAGQTISNDDSCGSCRGTWRTVDVEKAVAKDILSSLRALLSIAWMSKWIHWHWKG